jgi:recombination protein RecR
MRKYTPEIQRLLDEFQTLPGVGPKTAERYVFSLLRRRAGEIDSFTTAVIVATKSVSVCKTCFTVGHQNPCEICSDGRRDASAVCVVAEPQDIGALEATGTFRGRYHVLGGHISPLEGITAERLRTPELLERLQSQRIREVILAFSPNLDGETTILALSGILKNFPVRVTRLARGLPMGAELQYADEVTLSDAINGRRDVIR